LALNLSWRYQAKDIFNAKLVKTMFWTNFQIGFALLKEAK
jgi:hypothetical protein